MTKIMKDPNAWVDKLEVEDIKFIKRFILNSGSLKDMAKEYEVTYPTVRLRLDKLIQKINIYDNEEDDVLISLIKEMVMEDKLDFEAAKILINTYKYKGDD